EIGESRQTARGCRRALPPHRSTVAPWSSNIVPNQGSNGVGEGQVAGSRVGTSGAMARISQCSIRLELVLIIPPQRGVLLVLDEIAAAGRQYVDLRAHEAAEGILGRAYDRLAAHVEAGVDQDGASGQRVKATDEVVVKRIGLAMHRLHAGGIIDVRDRRDAGARHVELVDPEQPLLLARHFAAMAL